MLSFGEWLCVFSGILQAFGYLVYFRTAWRDEIDPNPATWLMFAYDTTLLVLLHAALGAKPAILFLPTVCATCSIVVALIGWRRVGFCWPRGGDRAAMLGCLVLTAAYVGITGLAAQDLISGAFRRSADIVLLFSNGSTCVSLVPLLHVLWRDHAVERPAAWLIWAGAYGFLLASTLLVQGTREAALLVYPVCNIVLHGLVAWLCRPRRRPVAHGT